MPSPTDHSSTQFISRRRALERIGVAVGGVVSSSIVAGVLAGCRASPPSANFSPVALDERQFTTVGRFADVIIPRTDTPGAIDAGVPSFVDQMLSTWFAADERDAFLLQLERLDAEAERRFGVAFAAADDSSCERLISEIAVAADAGAPSELNLFFRKMKELTLVGYYTSEVGATQELRRMPMSEWKADVPYDSIGRAWT